MSQKQILEAVAAKRLVPVAVINSVEEGLKLAEALITGGLNVIEVTLRTPAAKDAMAAIKKEFPDMLLGAGTVLDAEIVQPLADLGVKFFISPGLNPKVVEAAQAVDLPITPGVCTPTEVEQARALGCSVVKFFPAEQAGGVAMLKALAGPYGHTGLKFIPTGGIDAEKAKAYWALPTVAAVGGSWFVKGDLVKAGKFDEIARLTAEAVALAQV